MKNGKKKLHTSPDAPKRAFSKNISDFNISDQISERYSHFSKFPYLVLSENTKFETVGPQSISEPYSSVMSILSPLLLK